tara:strand:- start:1011 stop:1376 length:366 start_codon:yes stop_codon:yes gene_type:complete
MSKKLTKKEMEMAQYWHRKAFALLVNQKISTVLWREWDEYEKETGLVIVLDNGVALFISSDDEGNSPGAIHWNTGGDKPLFIPISTGSMKIKIEPHGILPTGVTETALWRKQAIEEGESEE